MASLYDSKKVRQAAKAVNTLTRGLEESAVKTAREAIQAAEPLRGQAAEALQDRLETLTECLTKICGDLDDVRRALNQYAVTLEAVDDELKAEM